jgi:DNA segregation ATPase FtsK/SpoIIIE, S-DNA-T family
MRLALTVLAADRRSRADVLVSVEGDATVGQVAEALYRALTGQPEPSLRRAGDPAEGLAVVLQHPSASWNRPAPALAAELPGDQLGLWLDGQRLDDTGPAALLLRDGAVVALGPAAAAATRLSEPRGVVEIRVSGGPAAGSVHRLALGAAGIGSAADCTVVLADPTVPALAATVVTGPAGSTVRPEGGTALVLDGAPVTEEVPWPPGGVLLVGDTVLTLHPPQEPDASLTPAEDGGLAYNRPPRLLPPRRDRRLVVPQEPVRGDGPRLQLLAAVIPAALGVGLAVIMKVWYFLLFALLTPLMMLGTYLSESRFGKKKHRQAVQEYQQALADYERKLEELRVADQADRRSGAPDPAEILLTATGPRRRLWERRVDDPDTLLLRIGVTDLPAGIELTLPPTTMAGTEVPPPPLAHSVPVPLPLTALGVVGIAGDRTPSRALARALVGQAAVLHSPRDLSIVVLAPGAGGAESWRWVQWLAHTAPEDGQDCVALVGTDTETVSRRVAELVAEINRRRDARNNLGAASAAPDRNVLVVLDGARALRRVPGMPQVLSEGPQVGVYALCIDDDERLLPEECRTVANWIHPATGPRTGVPSRLTLRGGGLEAIGEVLADQVGEDWCERLARALSPVRDVSRDEGDAGVPDSARLLELLGMADPTADAIIASWAADGRTTTVPIGYYGGGVFSLDLRRDGPHALIAGTTGAGKSELLQTLIASLAVANRPDALTFVLVDYKGGSAFAECARLPHTVGMVTDLDGYLTERALASLSAELKRREEILFHAAVKDLDDYWDARDRNPYLGLEPLPRLVLVIDEFASLVAELPDFVKGLVAIAQRGRSLGVHLVLATQRPAGVVSGDISANTNLRIALRVTDSGESTDVIGAPDAATIAKSTPGRCYVRSGASSLTAVQAARVGGRRPAAAGDTGPSVTALEWTDLARPLPLPVGAGDESAAVTDLAVLVDAIRHAADRLGVAEQRSPWLPPLTEIVTLDQLPAVPAGPDGDVPPLAFGLVDVPAEQARAPLALDLASGGHLLVAGSPRSGRSTALRTLAGAVAAGTSPADVHLYGIDCGGNALLPLLGLPHCGAVVTRDQPERVDRLLGRLLAEVTRRQQLLAVQGASSLAEQRAAAAPEERLPWMVLLLDRWEGFTAAFESYDLGRLVEVALRLLREGPAVGLRAVVTSDRSGMVGQVSTVFDDRFVLRLADPNDWSLAGVPVKEVPGSLPPGRGLSVRASEGFLECQLALLDRDPAGPAQTAALQALGRAAAARTGILPAVQRPMRVDALPARVTAVEARRLAPDAVTPPLWALVGVGGDELAPVGPDLLACSPGFVVAGPPRSGRSTVLTTMTRWLTEHGTPVVLLTPRRSPLRNLASLAGVLGVLGADDPPDRIGELVGGLERYVVLADDAELLQDTPLGNELDNVVRQARDGEHAVVAAGTADVLSSQYRGFVVEIRRSRSGLLLAPTGAPNEGDLFGVRLPRGGGGGPVGRGLLILGGTVTPVQAALPD